MPSFVQKFIRGVTSAIDSGSGLTNSERKRLIDAIDKAKSEEPPPTLAIIGEAGVGKSTTINSLFNAGQPVSPVKATTLRPVSVYVDVTADDVMVSGSKGILRIFDMPGLGDDLSTYEQYKEIYLEVLPMADVILWVHPVYDRMIQFVQTAVAELFGRRLPQLASRLVFGLNKADVIEPNDWNMRANVPSERQVHHLELREEDFSSRIRQALPQWSGRAAAYSAVRRYQLTSLFKTMIYAVPPERRWVLEDRMDLADFFELVDNSILRAAIEQHNAVISSMAGSTAVKDHAALRGQETAQLVRTLESMSEVEYREFVANRRQLIDLVRRSGISD